MKNLIVIFFLFLSAIACSHDDEPTDQGCLTGINSHGDRVLIRCCTQKQYAAGSNVNAGGIATWENYSGHQWEKCDDCK